MTSQELTKLKKLFAKQGLRLESPNGYYKGIKYEVCRQEGVCYRINKELGKIVHIQQNRRL